MGVGFGFRVEGLARVRGLGYRVPIQDLEMHKTLKPKPSPLNLGLGFRVYICRVWDSFGFRVSALQFWVLVSGFRPQGLGFRVFAGLMFRDRVSSLDSNPEIKKTRNP